MLPVAAEGPTSHHDWRGKDAHNHSFIPLADLQGTSKILFTTIEEGVCCWIVTLCSDDPCSSNVSGKGDFELSFVICWATFKAT